MRIRSVAFTLAFVLMFLGYLLNFWVPSRSYSGISRTRTELALRNTNASLELALVRPDASSASYAYVAGAMMALEEINQQNGRRGIELTDPHTGELFYRPMNLTVYDSPALNSPPSIRLDANVRLAREISDNPNVVAVLGHGFDMSVPASVVYNARELLYLSSNCTAPALTSRQLPFVFRISPTDDDIMYQMIRLVPHLTKTHPKSINLLVISPNAKQIAGKQTPAQRLLSAANLLIQDKRLHFSIVEELIYDDTSLDKLLYNHLPLLLEKHRGHFNVIYIADDSIAVSTAIRERIETIWADLVLDRRRYRKDLYLPTIVDPSDLIEYAIQSTDPLTEPTDAAEASDERIAKLILERSKQKAVVLHEREDLSIANGGANSSSMWSPLSRNSGYGTRLSAYLEESQNEYVATGDPNYKLYQLESLKVLATRSFDPRGIDFDGLSVEIANMPADYVFIIGFHKNTIELIKKIRRAQKQAGALTVPIITNSGVDSLLNVDDNTKGLEETYTAATFDVSNTLNLKQFTSFLRAYEAYLRNKKQANDVNVSNQFPGSAAYGYVSIYLLKIALEGAKSAAPSKVAEYAKLFLKYDGPLGLNTFQGGRDLLNLPIIFKRLDTRDVINLHDSEVNTEPTKSIIRVESRK